MDTSLRIALADIFVPPYRIPLYSELASTPGWEFKVFSSCKTEYDRSWEIRQEFPFAHKYSFSLSFKRTITHSLPAYFCETKEVHLPLSFLWDLWNFSPDVIISAGMAARSLTAAAYAHIARKRLVIWAYSTIHTSRDITWKEQTLRKVMYKLSHAFIGMGKEARKYLESLGVPSKSIFDTGQAVDHALFKCILDQEDRILLRRQFGISGLCFLFVGGMLSGKGIRYLLDAWGIFCMQIKANVSLLLVGNGPQKEDLMNYAVSRRLKNVKFLPFVRRERLHELYCVADIFVHPTLQDSWAQVLGEAMASGLPVLCSKYDGGSSDIIIEGQNGWIMDPLDIGDIMSKLQMAWESRDKKEEMSNVAKRAVAGQTYSRMADGIRSAVDYAVYKKY